MAEWEGLTPPYRTIVADPPWEYNEGWPAGSWSRDPSARLTHYSSMDVAAISALPVVDIAAPDAHLYLWTTNRYLRAAFDVAEAWGFTPRQTLVWCKTPQGIGPGGSFSVTAEFVIFAKRGNLPANERIGSSWWEWSRGKHSAKPAAFMDLVERVSPGPRAELFAREPRLGWDSWGFGYEAAS